jgi:hypothetical protein
MSRGRRARRSLSTASAARSRAVGSIRAEHDLVIDHAVIREPLAEPRESHGDDGTCNSREDVRQAPALLALISIVRARFRRPAS